LLRRIDAQGRVRSEFIRAAIEYYLYCLDRNRGALAEQAIAMRGCAVQIVDATGRIVASGPVSLPTRDDRVIESNLSGPGACVGFDADSKN
jgi:hypothetical protein